MECLMSTHYTHVGYGGQELGMSRAGGTRQRHTTLATLPLPKKRQDKKREESIVMGASLG